MRWSIPLLVALSGCATGAASFVLKSPVEDKCKELKLKSCNRLADGVVLYVDGDKSRGYAELKAGIAANSDEPLKLKALASGLKLLQKAPGVGPYVAPLRPVIELVDDAATEALQRRRSDDEEPDNSLSRGTGKTGPEIPETIEHPAGLPVRGGSVGAVRTGTVTWAQKGTERCSLLSAAPGLLPNGSATCAMILDGPLVVTDLHGGPCPVDLLIFSGDPERPRWFVHAPAAMRLDVHGAALAVQAGAPLYVAAIGAEAPPGGASCAVTWSARRPGER